MKLQGLAQTGGASQIKPATTPSPLKDGGPAKALPAFGSTPAAAVSLSAQAQAKAYAIKHGRDPDGVQDGK